MYIDHLSLMDFRTYSLLNLPLNPGVTVFLGSNGVGKTNIVEAIDYTANLSSHRVSNDSPLVRVGASRAFIRTRVIRSAQQTVTEFEIAPGRSNRVRINRAAPVRAREALGIVSTVLFSPEDLQLIKGEPSYRRRFLDDLAIALRPSLAAYRSDFERILRQRNTLLKSMRRGNSDDAAMNTLEVWNEQLAVAGAHILQARLRILSVTLPQIQRAYGELTDGAKAVTLTYESAIFPAISSQTLPKAALMSVEDLRQSLLQGFSRKQSEEIDRGITLIGPHRDEIVFELGGIPARGFASHGETWSMALALRLGSWYVHLSDDESPGASPILILDDVFAELDSARRHRLGKIVSEAEQVLVTCAVPSDIPQELGEHPSLVYIQPGNASYAPDTAGEPSETRPTLGLNEPS